MNAGEVVSIAIAVISVVIAVTSAAIAWRALGVAQRAERRSQQARLTVENVTRSSHGAGWDIGLSNLGFGSARHVVVRVVDAAGREIASSGDIASGGPAIHSEERRTLTARPREFSAGALEPEYPLVVQAEWKHWELDEHETHQSSIEIKRAGQENASPRGGPKPPPE